MVLMGKGCFEDCCLHRIAAIFKNHMNDPEFVIIGRSLEEPIDGSSEKQTPIQCNCHRKIQVFLQKASIGSCTFCYVKYQEAQA